MSGGGAGHRPADSAAPSAGSGPGGSLRLRWLQASHLKVRNQLVGNLCEDRLGQGRPGSLKTSTHTKALIIDSKRSTQTHCLPYVFEFPEWDKLDNVSGNSLPHCGPENTIISIQKFHGLKVCGAHPHDDDGHRQQRGPNDGVPGLVEVGDLAIGQDEQDKVLLQETRRQLLLGVFRNASVGYVSASPHRGSVALDTAGSDGSHVIYDGGEVCGSGEFQLGQHHPVGVHDPLNTWRTWENVCHQQWK